jgi:hypothetical protein
MPMLSTNEAAERLARAVERAKPSDLGEIYAELFPEETSSKSPAAGEIARQIRSGLAAEELVDLWNVLFPGDRNVWYNEETRAIHYNEEMAGYAE